MIEEGFKIKKIIRILSVTEKYVLKVRNNMNAK